MTTQALTVNPTLRDISVTINRILEGRLNNASSVTLTANAASTVVNDNRVESDSCIALSPLTANAAGAVATTYISARAAGSFTIAHANNAQTDKTFAYCVNG